MIAMGTRNGSNIHLSRRTGNEFRNGVLRDGLLTKTLHELALSRSDIRFGSYDVHFEDSRISVYEERPMTSNPAWDSKIATCMGIFSIGEDEIRLDTYEESFSRPAKFLYDLVHTLRRKLDS
jgi:hypothetical protein